jgi:hypothetical protein
MIEEIEMLCQCNKIRKHSMKSQDSDGLEHGQGLGQQTPMDDEIDEEKICSICYFQEKNVIFVPCGHSTCQKCIQVHTQNR